MFPIGDENPTLRRPVVTYLLLAALFLVWLFVQGGGFDAQALAATVCNLGLVPGELTGEAPVGRGVPIGEGRACVVDRSLNNCMTPLTSKWLHGSWGHLVGNALVLWVFSNNIEGGMRRLRFLIFYLLCGLAAAVAQDIVSPA